MYLFNVYVFKNSYILNKNIISNICSCLFQMITVTAKNQLQLQQRGYLKVSNKNRIIINSRILVNQLQEGGIKTMASNRQEAAVLQAKTKSLLTKVVLTLT